MGASVLIVEELTGKRRRVTLRGGGLPFRGAQWSGELSVMTQWNAGNPEATQHVLAPQEMPSSWEGEWNINRLVSTPCLFTEQGGSDQNVVLPYSLVDIFDSIRRGGQLLRVTWTEVSPGTAGLPPRDYSIKRQGRLTEFTVRPERKDDIPWSMTFDWVGRGENQRRGLARDADVFGASRSVVAAANAAIARIQQNALRSRDGVQNATTRFRIGDLEALADGPIQLVDSFARTATGIVNRVKQLGDLIIKVRETPAAIAGQGIDVATNAVSVANQFVDRISREGPEAWNTKNKVSNLTRAASYYGDSQTQAELMAGVAQEYANSLRRRRSSFLQSRGSRTGSPATANDIIAVHIVREGETLHSISMRYYETDLSAELARANGLPAYTIEPPRRQPLIIPTRTSLEARQSDSV